MKRPVRQENHVYWPSLHPVRIVDLPSHKHQNLQLEIDRDFRQWVYRRCDDVWMLCGGAPATELERPDPQEDQEPTQERLPRSPSTTSPP